MCDNLRMLENQDVEYGALEEALAPAAATGGAAEGHGFVSGLICASGFADPAIWSAELFEDYHPGERVQARAHSMLQALAQDSLARLNSPELDFELLLPGQDRPLAERTEALGNWCQGYLSGLGMGGLPESGQLSDEVRELLEDFSQLSRVDFELDEPDEEDEAAFEEVVEYIRIAALYIHEELQPGRVAGSPRIQ